MKKQAFFLSATILLGTLVGCGGAKTSASITFDDSLVTSSAAIKELKASFSDSKIQYKESGADYNIVLEDIDSSLGEQAYKISLEGSTIKVTGGDATGLMYGAYQVAEEIRLYGISKVKEGEGTPYLKERGFRLNPLLDCRTPSYTASGDATRLNMENTWDLSFWDGLFQRMSKMRYNIFDFSETCTYPSMIKVEGYEDCALEDIWVYDGEYDDTYSGNNKNMFREEHIAPGNYHVMKKMTMDEKIKFWQDVIALCHSYGIKFEYDTMNIYTFSEEHAKYGITNDRANPTTKDYYYKATKTFLETYDIDIFKTNAGENMDYPADTRMETEQWIYDTYGKAIIDAYGKREDKKDFILVYEYSEQNWELWKDFPFQFDISTRYADTHMYAVTNPVYTQEKRDALPDGVYDMYNLRNEDAYHFTWADRDWIRDFCKNMKDPKSNGFIMGSAGYYMGKEYEFVKESDNGGYYYDRHWLNYDMFGRFSYDINLSDEYYQDVIYNHYKGVDKAVVDNVMDALTNGSKWLTEFQKLFYFGGTDSAWYPETCQSHPTMGGYLGIKKFVNADNAYGGSGVLSIAGYAKEVKAGKTTFSGKTPFEVASTMRENAKKTDESIAKYNAKNGNAELNGIIEDQKAASLLAKFYAEKIETGTNLRLFNDSGDTKYKDLALSGTESVISYWNQYSDAFLSRFKKERFTRMGMVDPEAYKEEVAKDTSIIQKWVSREY